MGEISTISVKGCMIFEYCEKLSLNLADCKMIATGCLKDWQDFLQKKYPYADVKIGMSIVSSTEVARMTTIEAMEVNEGGVYFPIEIAGLEEVLQDRMNNLMQTYLEAKKSKCSV
ncbi:hypothetical protein [Solidesulfovibrio alcoholivorans]|uniref:hypothetical protein n=1 Tax=Solidesulfovibrio alcoholivorans TaxID=81406 RepID=UPI0012EC2715|nr:hypothetical protein [Solidesulfovibrio alcoholivorans]